MAPNCGSTAGASTANEIGPYVGNPQRAVEQIMLDMGATVWTEHLGKVDHMFARMPAYTTPNRFPTTACLEGAARLLPGDGRQPLRQPGQPLVGLHAGAEPGRQAFLIWMSWKGWGTGGVDFSRIGTVIH